MTRISEGHLARHFQGVRGGRDAALLDIAQDHALQLLHAAAVFDQGLIFKGGTALRKFRAGATGRFSTDLDFCAPSEEIAFAALAAIDGQELDGFSFSINNLSDNGRRGDLAIDTPFGRPLLGAKIELARHDLSLTSESLLPVRLPIHETYGFSLPPTPVIASAEAIAEKLARFGRVALARDLYDLYWFAKAGAFDERLIRRLWVLKSYRDAVVDGRGAGPIDPRDVLRERPVSAFRSEEIGPLTQRVDVGAWVATVRHRFKFLADVDVDEARWLQCNARDLYEVQVALRQL